MPAKELLAAETKGSRVCKYRPFILIYLGLINISLVYIDVRYQNSELKVSSQNTKSRLGEFDIMFALTANPYELVKL